MPHNKSSRWRWSGWSFSGAGGLFCSDFFGRGRHPFVCLIGIAPEQRTARRKNARASADAATAVKPDYPECVAMPVQIGDHLGVTGWGGRRPRSDTEGDVSMAADLLRRATVFLSAREKFFAFFSRQISCI
jgi:hypothetical protein